jgi:hypothetical protein
MHQAVARALDEVDAAVFGGDDLHGDRESLELFKEYLGRWTRALPNMEAELAEWEGADVVKVAVFAEHTNLCGRICRDPEVRNPDDIQLFEGSRKDLFEVANLYDRLPSAYGTRVAKSIRSELTD